MQMSQTLRTLLDSLIDYAGLFPPAALELSPAIENYARFTRTTEAFALGRFICPASQLKQFSQTAAMLMPGTFATSGYREMADSLEAWRVSVIIDQPLDVAIDLIDGFNEHHAEEEHGLAAIDSLEMKLDAPDDVDAALEIIPDDILPFFEFPSMDDPRGCIASLAGADAAAKIRCGGVTPSAIPSPHRIAAFIAACAIADVPFKATAGLHHPIRADQPLTYDANPPRAVMHGFINVFLAAALLHHRRIDQQEALAVLDETDAAAFMFNATSCGWRDRTISLDQLSETRETFALGYGSCSFDEPLADLRSLSWVR